MGRMPTDMINERNIICCRYSYRKFKRFSPRAIDTLESVDFIAAEDTRVTLKLLNHFDIKKKWFLILSITKGKEGRLSAKEYLQVKAVQLLPMQVCRLFPTR